MVLIQLSRSRNSSMCRLQTMYFEFILYDVHSTYFISLNCGDLHLGPCDSTPVTFVMMCTNPSCHVCYFLNFPKTVFEGKLFINNRYTNTSQKNPPWIDSFFMPVFSGFLIQECGYLIVVRDRVRTKMERDILAEMNHNFIVKLHYGKDH